LRVGVLFSGGKDSAYSAYLASQRDTLTCLVTLRPRRDDSYMFHFPNLRWTYLQAESMGLPQVVLDTAGEKEAELEDLRSALKSAKEDFFIEGVYTGALASVYQKSRVERICGELDLQSISPLWGIDPETHLRNLIKDRFSVMVTGVAAMGLDETWLGRMLDERLVRDLVELQRKFGLHAGLEGGEGETFVLDCPLFEKKVEVLSSQKHWNGVNGYLEFLEVRLAEKLA
jgi:diphthine-ammonia ligase